ncbi:hypothetical protein QYE76_021801 [Lolium multiflorum]|uniref:Ribonuclease H n=1 Tax=Lolium multiflorum TaxID=4521 RepID=A0AAD8RA74_LOLMU|nr:hypothetical protein QYE76_021801 [Lolium multiflorum]
MTYYVVFEGRVPGVYEEWEECKKQVHKFSGNCYKGYPTRHEAVAKWRKHQSNKSKMKMKIFLVLSLLLIIIAVIEIKKEHQVLMVNKTTGFKKQGKSKGKFKKGGKKAATPPMKPKNGPKPDAECYYCKEKGHWKRNCSKYRLI